MKNDFSLTVGGPELLQRVGPLWIQLRDHHAALAPQWADTLAKSFEERRVGLIEKGAGGLCVVLASQEGNDVGYCISTIITSHEGEIDSLYVMPALRNNGIGKSLMAKTMEWFASKSIKTITVDVIAGNEAVQKFYEKFRFSARTTRLRYLA
jgi:ribosomal protein S18 acetylase RimI-like enzyme